MVPGLAEVPGNPEVRMRRGGPLFLIQPGLLASSLPWETQLYWLYPNFMEGKEQEGAVGTAPKGFGEGKHFLFPQTRPLKGSSGPALAHPHGHSALGMGQTQFLRS